MENTIISSKTGIKLQETQYKKKLLYVTFSYIVLIPNWTKMGIYKKFKPAKLFESQIEQNSHSNSHLNTKIEFAYGDIWPLSLQISGWTY